MTSKQQIFQHAQIQRTHNDTDVVKSFPQVVTTDDETRSKHTIEIYTVMDRREKE